MLAPTPKGNLGPVWKTITDDAEALINERAGRQGPIDAEISPSAAEWFLVRTYPGDDVRALRWLARRHFGVFQPIQQRRLKKEGERLVQGWESAFPGWLFVLCWDIDKMRGRIVSCPGVMGLLCDPATNRPVPIEDDFIDRLRALAWIYNDHVPHAHHYASAARHIARMRPKNKKIDKRTKRTLHKLKNELKAQGKWDSSTWEHANELAPHERIALLQRALNAPSLSAVAG
jgi:hypothetical protein